MSAASHLRISTTGAAVPNDLGYSVPGLPSAHGNSHQTKRRAKPVGKKVPRINPIWVASLGALICLAIGIGMVAQKAQLMTLHYELAELQAQLADLEKERTHLELSLVKARSPEKIEQIALARLGMRKPEQVEYLVWEGLDAPEEELSVAVHEAKTAASPIAVVGRWFTNNWPHWGKAEASPRP